MRQYLTVVLCVLVVMLVCHTEARRGGKGRRGGRRGGRGGGGREGEARENEVRWVRVLPGEAGEVVEANEQSFSMGDQVFVVSKDKRPLKRAGFKASKTVFDFTAGAPPMAIVKVKQKCFVLPVSESLTKEALLAQVAAYNEGRREEDNTEELFVTNLTEANSQSLQSRPQLTEMCSRSRRPPMALTNVEPTPSESDAGRVIRKTMKVSSLNSFLSITKIKTRGGRNRGGGGRRRGNRRGGRRRNRE